MANEPAPAHLAAIATSRISARDHGSFMACATLVVTIAKGRVMSGWPNTSTSASSAARMRAGRAVLAARRAAARRLMAPYLPATFFR